MNKVIFDTEKRQFYTQPSYSGIVRPLLKENDPRLKQPSEPFVFEEQNAVELAWDLIATMQNHKGCGIAAPQIGVFKRVFISDINNKYMPVFNPEILWQSEDIYSGTEFCLTFGPLCLDINRPQKIQVKFYNEQQTEIVTFLEKQYAKVFLHEYDHIEGKLFTDHVKPVALNLAKTKRAKLLKKMKD